MTKELQEVIYPLLQENKVNQVIGYTSGTLPYVAAPVLIRKPENVKTLIWDIRCANNLATYLIGVKEKTAIIAKGCDIRSIIGLIQENQIERGNLHIVGLVCKGILDQKKSALLSAEEIKKLMSDPSLPDKYCPPKCGICRVHTPTIYDTLIGEPQRDEKGKKKEELLECPEVAAIDKMNADERWQYWQKQLEKCTRCRACIKICPLCFCPECFVEKTRPFWTWLSNNPSENVVYHTIRAFHLAGRCVDCGECDRACPVDIPLRQINIKLAKEIFELFDYETGFDQEVKPPLNVFKPEDPEHFMTVAEKKHQ